MGFMLLLLLSSVMHPVCPRPHLPCGGTERSPSRSLARTLVAVKALRLPSSGFLAASMLAMAARASHDPPGLPQLCGRWRVPAYVGAPGGWRKPESTALP
jgi:hypothetical protein